MGRITCKRHFIYLANLEPVTGHEMGKVRPVVVISPTNMNQALETVVICPLTTSLRPHWKTRIQTISNNKTSEIALDQIRTIDQSKIIKEIEALNSENALSLSQKISELYGSTTTEVL